MKKYIGLIFFCAIAISIIGCGKEKALVEKAIEAEGPVLAKIGDEVITLTDFNEKLQKLPDSIRSIAEKNKASYLDNLVLETLLYKEALKRRLDKDQEIQELFTEAKRKIVIARLAQDEVEDKIKLQEKELMDYYKDNKAQFIIPEMLRASHVLVKSIKDAAEIVDKLNAGALFEEVAEKYSLDVTSKRGGDIGYFSAGEMVPEFEDACQKLQIGEISGPVKTKFGYHIIKLTDKKEPTLIEFGKVKDKIETFLRTKKRQELLTNFIARLKQDTDVTINSELLVPQEEEEESEKLPTEEWPSL